MMENNTGRYQEYLTIQDMGAQERSGSQYDAQQQYYAQQGLSRSARASQTLASLAGLGYAFGSLGVSVANPELAGQAYASNETKYIKPDKKEYDLLGEAAKILTSNASKQLLKGVITFLVMYLIITVAVFGCSELYEYFSLLDV